MSLPYGNPLDGYGYSTASGCGFADVRVSLIQGPVYSPL
jgi:hypothetical protein